MGDVISLLWFKRSLPKYATRFIDMCVMLCADHGPCVSGEPSPFWSDRQFVRLPTYLQCQGWPHLLTQSRIVECQ